MSVTKWGCLKSGKLNIVKLNHDLNKIQKDDGCSTNLTLEENSSIDLSKNDDLTESCTPSKKCSENKNFNSPRAESTSSSTASSSHINDQFFIPPEIYDIYRGYANNSIIGAKDIVEYYFDSCSSEEENCEKSEIKSSDLSSDSLLFDLLLRFKKKKSTSWKKSISTVKKKSLNSSESSTSLRETEISSTDKDNESATLKPFSSDSSVVNCEGSELSILKDSSDNISDSIIKSQEVQNLSSETDIDTLIESNTNSKSLFSENFIVCETKNSPVKESDNSINTQLEISSFVGPFSQKDNLSENNSDIIFLENYISAQNRSAKENNIASISKKHIFSDSLINTSCDISTVEIDRSPCNEENMGKFNARYKVEGVNSSKSSHTGSDDDVDEKSNTLKLVKKNSLNSLQSTKENSSDSESSSVDSRHSSDSSSDTENLNKNKTLLVNKNSNLSKADLNNLPRMKDSDEEDFSITSTEKNTEINIDSIKVDKQNYKKRIAHDLSSGDDSETDRSGRGTLALGKGKDKQVDNYVKNNGIDQRELERTNTDYVIKLSSDSESDSEHSSESKTASPESNRTSERHVSVSSNESDLGNPDEGTTISNFKINESSSQIQSNLQIDFNKDFLRRNEIWLVQCPKNMDVNNIKGQFLNIPNRTVVHVHGCKYECYVHCNDDDIHQTINLATPYDKNNFSLSVVPLEGNVIFEEKLDIPEITSITVNAKRKLPLPDGLKVRHPLLGLDYHTQPSTKISESNTTYKQKKKHKKKKDSLPIGSGENQIQIETFSKKRKSENTPTPISNGNESDDSLNYIFKPAKKNKRKRSDGESLEISSIRANLSTIDDLTSITPKKKKKRTKSPSQVDSENLATVDDLTLRLPKKKKKSHKSALLVDTTIEQTEMSLTETPKETKKKRKRTDSTASLDATIEQTEMSFSETPKVKKKKRKRTDSTASLDASYEKNALTFEDEISKKKKKKSKSRNTSFEEEAEDVQLDIEKPSSKKKKKKHSIM